MGIKYLRSIFNIVADTERLYYKLDSEVCARYGKEFTTTIKRKIMGTTELRSAEMIIEELNLPVTPEEYLKQLSTLAIQRIGDVELMPGNCHPYFYYFSN